MRTPFLSKANNKVSADQQLKRRSGGPLLFVKAIHIYYLDLMEGTALLFPAADN